MKMEDIRKLTPDERSDKLLELRKNLMEQRFKKAAGQLEKSHELREARRTIARIKTLATELPPAADNTKTGAQNKE